MLMAYPDATIYQVSDEGLTQVEYRDTEHYTITKSFLQNPERSFQELFKD
jgi:predicted ATPase